MGIPETIRFGGAICGDLHEADRREWWLANEFGGYAAGTIAGSLTRRYQLLIAPVEPPLGRRLIWPKAEALLGTNQPDLRGRATAPSERRTLAGLVGGLCARGLVAPEARSFCIETITDRNFTSAAKRRISVRGCAAVGLPDLSR